MQTQFSSTRSNFGREASIPRSGSSRKWLDFKINARHLLTGEELDSSEILSLLELASELKALRNNGDSFDTSVRGKSLAMIFDKASLRTRFSFTVAMNELGGFAIESVSANRKTEEPEDTARVLSGYCQAIMVRTFEDASLERMATVSGVPVINGLSDLHHPCQILADLLTLRETFGKLNGLTLTYLGDGNNILHSLLLMAPQLGVHVRYSCPKGYEPNPAILERAQAKAKLSPGSVAAYPSPEFASHGADAFYTDVWVSMGQESEKKAREIAFRGYQLNESLVALGSKNAVVMHCLPMARGQEISNTLPDAPCSVIFNQSENRLHVQKALLIGLL